MVLEDDDAGAVIEHIVGGERAAEGEAEKAGNTVELLYLPVSESSGQELPPAVTPLLIITFFQPQDLAIIKVGGDDICGPRLEGGKKSFILLDDQF